MLPRSLLSKLCVIGQPYSCCAFVYVQLYRSGRVSVSDVGTRDSERRRTSTWNAEKRWMPKLYLHGRFSHLRNAVLSRQLLSYERGLSFLSLVDAVNTNSTKFVAVSKSVTRVLSKVKWHFNGSLDS